MDANSQINQLGAGTSMSAPAFRHFEVLTGKLRKCRVCFRRFGALLLLVSIAAGAYLNAIGTGKILSDYRRSHGKEAFGARIDRLAKPVRPTLQTQEKRGEPKIGSRALYFYLRRHYGAESPTSRGPAGLGYLMGIAGIIKHRLVNKKLWPIIKCVIYANVNELRSALDSGGDPNEIIALNNPPGATTLLDIAIEAGQRSSIKLLINHGTYLNPTQYFTSQSGADSSEYDSPLVEAASNGEDDVVQLLLSNGANIEQTSNLPGYHTTALGAAVLSGNLPTAYLLLLSGADVSAVTGPSGIVPGYLNRVSNPEAANQVATLRQLLVAYGATASDAGTN